MDTVGCVGSMSFKNVYGAYIQSQPRSGYNTGRTYGLTYGWMTLEICSKFLPVEGDVVKAIRRTMYPDKVTAFIKVVLQSTLLLWIQNVVWRNIRHHEEQDSVVQSEVGVAESRRVLGIVKCDVMRGSSILQGLDCSGNRV